jgi:DNA processing protein
MPGDSRGLNLAHASSPVGSPAACDVEMMATLALSGAPGIGPVRYWKLIEAFGSAAAVVRARPSLLAQTLGHAAAGGLVEHLRAFDGEKEASVLAASGVTLVTAASPAYPLLLREIACPPPLMYVFGDPELLSLPGVAIVGTRRATPYGLGMARSLARDLAAAGLAITSGLARGIDTAAHEGALAARGVTIAVLGGGPDVNYPPENRNLRSRIAEAGAVVSLEPPGTPPDGFRFPIRNRIISGLTLGVVVVEAPEQSGALLTVRHAVEQNREVMAVPGQAWSRTATGCHRLIREGAVLVTSAEDVMAALPQWAIGRVRKDGGGSEEWTGDLGELEMAAYAAIEGGPRHPDELVRVLGRSAAEVATLLVGLELAGRVTRLADGRYGRFF